MKLLVRIAALLFMAAVAGALPLQPPAAAGQSTAAGPTQDTVFLPFTSSGSASSVAQSFNSNQSGILDTGGGHILSVSPQSVPTYRDGSVADISLSVEPDVTPPVPPPAWLRMVSPPATLGPEQFVFDFPLTVRMPVAGVKDISKLFFVRLMPSGEWTRSFFAFDPENPTAVETTLFTLGTMAVGEYDGPIAANLHPQGGLYVGNTSCPIGGKNCFYYLTIKNFVPKYPDEAPAGSFIGNTLRLRANATAESPRPTGWLLPQGTYTFCYSALESPLILSNLRKFINPNMQVVVINKPYACDRIFPCYTMVAPINQPGWIVAQDSRPCQMGAGTTASDPATLGKTGDFQATLTWQNSSSSATDLDLHLYGPNGLHVWYDYTTSYDGSLKLDQDWKTGPGDAVENIYQLKDGAGKSKPMPKGTYTVRVKHYIGASGKPYKVRVVYNGTVRNFSGTLSSGPERTLMTFTVP